MTYVQIYCETQRARDMRWRFRWVHDPERSFPGRCYAAQVEGRWRCCCCGKPVSVVT